MPARREETTWHDAGFLFLPTKLLFAGEEDASFFLHPPAIDFASEGSQLYQKEENERQLSDSYQQEASFFLCRRPMSLLCYFPTHIDTLTH
jgi:hypothetical protein